MLNKGCVGIIASLVVDGNGKSELADIPLVSEYQDIFPNELLGQPPEREVEFSINLVAGTTSISKAPYRMAPAELKELKEQLKELLECVTMGSLSSIYEEQGWIFVIVHWL